MEYEAFGGSGNAGELIPCQVCGRNFNPESLVKHERICRKVQVNSRKRKTFDSGKQRAKGTEIPISKTVRPGQQPKPQPVKQTNWRQKHQDFINAVRSARGVSHAMKTGAPLPPPPPPSVNPDFVECPTCSRRFNQKAAARHIPFCADRAKTFGAPVKPLQKRAAADVAGSTTGMRKAYDNKVVRKKPGSNPYAYADSQMYTSTFGQPGSQEYPSRGEPLGYGPGSSSSSRQRPQGGTGGGNVSISRHEGVGPKYSNARSASALKSSNRSQQSAQNRMRATGHIRFADQDGEALTSDILAHQGANVSWHGNQGAYRTTKASQARQQQSQQKRFSVAKNKGQAEQPTFETTIPLDENLTPRHDLAQQGMSPATRHHPMQSPSSTNVRRLPQMSPKTMSPKPSPNATLNGNSGGKPSPFCHGCGTKYPVEDARFCCSCGSKRAYLT